MFMCSTPLTAVHFFFFFNDTATTEIYTLSLHDALPISVREHARRHGRGQPLGADERIQSAHPARDDPRVRWRWRMVAAAARHEQGQRPRERDVRPHPGFLHRGCDQTVSPRGPGTEQARREATRLLPSSDCGPGYFTPRRAFQPYTLACSHIAASICARTRGASLTSARTTAGAATTPGNASQLPSGWTSPPHVYNLRPSTPSSVAGMGISCGVFGSSWSTRRWL